MIKKNFVKCENCGKTFNNYYKRGKWSKVGCCRVCARKLLNKFNVKKNREKRQKLRAEKRCIICAKKIKPIIVYYQFCPKHKPESKLNQTGGEKCLDSK